MPNSSNLWPSMPRNCTVDKSGSFRFASPPVSSVACAKAEVELSSHIAAAAATNFATRHAGDKALLDQVRINAPPQNFNVGLFTPISSATTPAHEFNESAFLF